MGGDISKLPEICALAEKYVIENEEAFEQIESKDENTVYFILEE